jgi:hypothetical protein
LVPGRCFFFFFFAGGSSLFFNCTGLHDMARRRTRTRFYCTGLHAGARWASWRPFSGQSENTTDMCCRSPYHGPAVARMQTRDPLCMWEDFHFCLIYVMWGSLSCNTKLNPWFDRLWALLSFYILPFRMQRGIHACMPSSSGNAFLIFLVFSLLGNADLAWWALLKPVSSWSPAGAESESGGATTSRKSESIEGSRHVRRGTKEARAAREERKAMCGASMEYIFFGRH